MIRRIIIYTFTKINQQCFNRKLATHFKNNCVFNSEHIENNCLINSVHQPTHNSREALVCSAYSVSLVPAFKFFYISLLNVFSSNFECALKILAKIVFIKRNFTDGYLIENL
jgi:hypothetical protein